ncbi:MAG: hypothetical protein AB7S78_12960 [Candidatus Omnitrophota bacterium]
MSIEIIPITQVSTIEAFANTLKSDYQVNRWFLYIMQQPSASEELCKSSEVAHSFSRLKTWVIVQRFLFLTVIPWAVTALFFPINWISVISLAVLVTGMLSVAVVKINLVKKIALHMLQRDFGGKSLEKLTLYEVGEFYGRKYNTTALVDKLNKAAVIYRVAVAASLFIGVFIFSFKFIELVAFTLMGLFISRLTVNTDFFYKRLS